MRVLHLSYAYVYVYSRSHVRSANLKRYFELVRAAFSKVLPRIRNDYDRPVLFFFCSVCSNFFIIIFVILFFTCTSSLLCNGNLNLASLTKYFSSTCFKCRFVWIWRSENRLHSTFPSAVIVNCFSKITHCLAEMTLFILLISVDGQIVLNSVVCL